MLCSITIPGLDVRFDWRVIHDRLLDEFPQVTDVLATTMNGTILIVHGGPADADAWLETVSEAILDIRRGIGVRRQEPANRAVS